MRKPTTGLGLQSYGRNMAFHSDSHHWLGSAQLFVPVALWKHCRAHMQLSIAQLVVLLIRWKPTTRSNPDWFHHSTGEIPCEYVKGTLVSQSDE